jgi:hypothetical protein
VLIGASIGFVSSPFWSVPSQEVVVAQARG